MLMVQFGELIRTYTNNNNKKKKKKKKAKQET